MLVKTQIPDLLIQLIGVGFENLHFSKFPGDCDAADVGTILRDHESYLCLAFLICPPATLALELQKLPPAAVYLQIPFPDGSWAFRRIAFSRVRGQV